MRRTPGGYGRESAQQAEPSGTYVPLAGPATITGQKDFTTAPTVNGAPIGAGLPSTFVSRTASATVAVGEWTEADATSGALAFTLPANPAVGALYAGQKIDASSNAVTWTPAAGGTINGDANASTTTRWAGAIFEHRGSNVWRIAASMSTTGPAGTNGTNGNTVLNGAGAPAAGTGVNGDFYIDTNAPKTIYGPKAAGAWPGSGVSMVPTGTQLDLPRNVPFAGVGFITASQLSSRICVSRVTGAATISKLRISVGAASGNICVGVYANSGVGAAAAPGARKATSGSVVCPAAGVRDVALLASVAVVEGDWFAIQSDNGTATFDNLGGGAIGNMWQGQAGLILTGGATLPLPATAPAVDYWINLVYIMLGIT